MHLVDVILDNRVSCSFIDTIDTENVIFCRPLEESLENVTIIEAKDCEFVHSFEESLDEKYLTTDIVLPDGKVFTDVRFKLVVCESGDLPQSTINTSILGLPYDVTSIEPTKQYLVEDTEEITIDDEVDGPIVISESKDPLYIQQALELEQNLVKLQQKEEALNKRQQILETNSKLQKSLEDYKSELIAEHYTVSEKQKDILSSYINDNVKNLYESIDDKFSLSQEKITDYINNLSNKNLEEVKELQDRRISSLRGDINTVLEDKIQTNAVNTGKLLIERSDELQKAYSEKLITELEIYKQSLQKELLELGESNTAEFLDKQQQSIKSNLTSIAETNKTIIDEKIQVVTTSFDERVNTITTSFESKLPLIDEQIQLASKQISELVQEKKNIEEVITSGKKYTDTQVSKAIQDAKDYARRILDLGGGGGSVAVQYANGGTMDGNLNVTGQYLSGGVDLASIFSGGGGGSSTAQSIYISGGDIGSIQPLLGNNTASGCYSTIGGGRFNTVLSGANYTVIAGGICNTVSSIYDVIGGGTNNCTCSGFGWNTIAGGQNICTQSGYNTFMGGGAFNTASCNYNVVVGGNYNQACGSFAAIVGGGGNSAEGDYSAIVGGLSNHANGNYTAVGGGVNNNTNGNGSVVAGGEYNCACQDYAVVSGGTRNSASARYSSVGGGVYNCVFNECTTIAGGSNNCACGTASFIGGGNGNNTILINYATIAGGKSNTVSAYASIVGGGLGNVAGGDYYNVVGGGAGNQANGSWSAVLGGSANCTNDRFSAVVGGELNCATTSHSSVVGGCCNVTTGNGSSVVGGQGNTASGNYSFVAAGINNNTNAKANTFILGSNILASQANFTYVNNISSQGAVCGTFYGSGSNLTGLSNIYSVSGTLNQINAISNGSNVTLSLPNSAVFPGSVTIGGNLTVAGSATYINTQNLVINDNIIYINQGEDYTSNILDTGIVSHFNDIGGLGYNHTGLIRRAGNSVPGVWTLFSGLTTEPASATNIDWTDKNIRLDSLSANILGNLSGSYVTVGTGNSNQWNTAYASTTALNLSSSIWNTPYLPLTGQTFNFVPATSSVTTLYGNNSATGTNTPLVLLHFDNTYTDSSIYNRSIIPYSNAALSAAQSKFGGYSLRANTSPYDFGTGGIYISSKNNDFIIGYEDYTIDFWVYPVVSASSQYGYYTLFNYGDDGIVSGNNSLFNFGINGSYSSDTFFIQKYGSNQLTATSYTIQVGTWTHIAVVRKNFTTTAYINGVAKLSYVDNAYYDNTYPYGITVGRAVNNGYWGGSADFDGYIDEFRFIKGYAAYTGSFTPPTTSYSLSSFTYPTNSQILNGTNNLATGRCSSILTGNSNRTIADYSLVESGCLNTSAGCQSVIIGGNSNTVIGCNSTIITGLSNIATGSYSLIINGTCNKNNSYQSTIIQGTSGLIEAGISNLIGSGSCQRLGGNYSTILNGCYNTITGNSNTILNGSGNSASGYSTILGGCCNNISAGARQSQIGSGCCNCIISTGSGQTINCNNNISSGFCNSIFGSSYSCFNSSSCVYVTNIVCIANSLIASGLQNKIYEATTCTSYPSLYTTCSNYSTIINGVSGFIGNNSSYSSIINGYCSKISNSQNSTIINGCQNSLINNCYSTILNGISGCVTGNYSTIVNGKKNTASGNYSFIAAGSGNDTKGFANTFILGTTLSASAANYTYVNNISSQGIISTATLKLDQTPSTFTNPVTASGTFLIINVNGTNKALQLWDYSS